MTPAADAPESETGNHNIQLFRITKRPRYGAIIGLKKLAYIR